ncbi:signal peptide peptidase [Nitzschia inconspicua]|uniref:Signal peptide peptidase n=1 Tax=Nitzschia inconspicua TaxID=303405 RepID=A0A9K3L4J7_9STRA|nr:signal peptide peptidase [Nitzschia inconspicua]
MLKYYGTQNRIFRRSKVEDTDHSLHGPSSCDRIDSLTSSTNPWSHSLLWMTISLVAVWFPLVTASTPDVVVRITPHTSSTPLVSSSSSLNEYSTIEILTNRAQFGSRDDVSGILVHSPPSDSFLCTFSYANETISVSPNQPGEDYIMLVPRGFCSFEDKARAAQELYGVKGLLVYDRLGARYQWDTERQRVIFPQPQIDYECANGQGVVENLPLDPPAYNGSRLDPLLDMSRTDTSICILDQSTGGVCESQLCVVTSHEEKSTAYSVCCAWDLPFVMPAEKDTKSRHTKNIVVAFLTIRQAEQLAQTSFLGSQVTIESRSKIFNVSYFFMWALGTSITIFASWYAAGEYRRFGTKLKMMDERKRARRSNNNSVHLDRNSTQRRTISPGDREGILEMNQSIPSHANNGNLTEPQPNDSSEAALVQDRRDVESANEAQHPVQHSLGTYLPSESEGQRNETQKQEVWTLRSLPPPERRQRVRSSVSTRIRSTRQSAHAPETMPSFEMTYWHVLIFIVVASVLLILLFFFQFYKAIFVLYGIGCAGAISYVLFNPLVVWVISKFGDLTVEKFNRPILFRYNGFDVMSQLISYIWGAVWIWYGLTHFKPQQNSFFWITTDVFGACFCILVLSLLKLNSIKIATALMVAVFLYDIFFVFLTPYLTGGDSVMLAVASGGGGGESFCYKYPDDRSCTGVTFIPMLLIIPKVNDVMNGSIILGLGDIVLPGFLIAFCARYDAATRLVGSNSPALRLRVPNKWYKGFFFPMVVAYSMGLLLAFVAVLLMQQGQPALLYICPIILVTVFFLGRGKLKELWNGAEIFHLAQRLMARNERLWDRSQRDHASNNPPARDHGGDARETPSIEENGRSALGDRPSDQASSRDDGTAPETVISLDSTSTQPSTDDICFRDQSHPGTEAFVCAVKDATVEFAGENYSPKIHKKVRAQLKNRKFFKRDPSTQSWVVANKFEVRDEIGLAYDECRGKRSPFFDRSKN